MAQCWWPETSFRPFYDFNEIPIQQDLTIFSSWYLPFLNLPYLPFQKNETLETWHNRLLSNWSRLFNWKGAGAYSQFSKSFKWFQENIDLAYIYQLSRFGGWMSYGSKDKFKNAPCLRFGKSWDSWKYKNFTISRTEHNFSMKLKNS